MTWSIATWPNSRSLLDFSPWSLAWSNQGGGCS